MPDLTHLDSDGNVHQVDVGDKPITARSATARGRVWLPAACREALAGGGDTKKGNVFQVARIAAIQGAKRTADLIPLCHQVPLDGVAVEVWLDGEHALVEATARCHGRTGVEMEALTAVSTGCLCIYDMLKALSQDMRIDAVEVVAKSGGRSGDVRKDPTP